jgi:tRNA G10  N-methylase Trm11
MTNQYAFVLGRVHTLSLAELFILFKKHQLELKVIEASPEVLVVEMETVLDAEKWQKMLGGTVKILKVIDALRKRPQDSINFALQHYFRPSKIKKDFLKSYTGKIQFGISVYLIDMAAQAFGEPKRIGMFIKRAMQDSGASIRLVLPEFNSLALASVVVTKNGLLNKGAEICVLAGSETIYAAKTLSVQDFEDYGRRDYQRPIRDERRGMMPPKVAQMMLNYCGAKLNDAVLDPFCGIGTLVQEGALLGYRMLGTDIDPTAIAGSDKNLEWFRNRYKIPKGKYHLEVSDARTVSTVVGKLVGINAFKQITNIVTEGNLGPMYSKYPKTEEIQANFKDLAELYQSSFQEFLKFLPAKGNVILCLPAYKKSQTDYELFPYLDDITNLGYNITSLIPSNLAKSLPFLKLTERGSGIYDRKDQIVAREIIIFEKN